MSSLPDAERDAGEVVRVLAGLAALLRKDGVEVDDEIRGLLNLVDDSGRAAERVLAYLRDLRGPGDGEAVAVPLRLGPWRDWTPVRGHLLSNRTRGHRIDEIPNQPRRGDPGE